jgi:hypothetical protein
LNIDGVGFAAFVFAYKVRKPDFQIYLPRLRGSAAGQLQNVLNDLVHPFAVCIDDIQKSFFMRGNFLAFSQQLTRMADGAQWVSNFMGYAGGQSTEGGEFQLLCLLCDSPVVLHENQNVSVTFGLQRSEVDSDFVGKSIVDFDHWRLGLLAIAPLGDAF